MNRGKPMAARGRTILAWAAGLEDPSVLPTEAPVDPSAVEGARASTTHVVALSLRGRSRRAVLE